MTFKKSFKVGSKAQQYFEGPDALPETWLRRKQDPDFYVDYIVEIDEDDGPSGIKCGVQLKGTASPKYSKECLQFRLKTKHLAYYVDRSPEPVFLVVVDTVAMKGYWVHLQPWAQGTDSWRSKKSVTVDIQTANRLEDTESFREAIQRAVSSNRSVAAAARREAHKFERLDNRFKVNVNHIEGTTHVQLNPLKDVAGRISVHGPRAAKKLSQLVEKGRLTEFEPGEISLEGSEIFKHMIEDLPSGPVSLQAAKKIPCHISILTTDEQEKDVLIIAGRPAMLVAGTKEMHFELLLDKSPIEMRCTLGIDAANELAIGGFSLGFSYSRWVGQDLLLAAYFDHIYRLVKTVIDRRTLIVQCEIDGNVMFKAALNPDDLSPFQGALQLLELLRRARTVARYLDVQPKVPRLEELGPAEEDILYLWELIEYGKGSATVKDCSAELELPVQALKKALGSQPGGGSAMPLQALEACPTLFGCDTQKWVLQRNIPVTLTAESERVLAAKKDEHERVAVRVEAKAGTTCATKLVPMPRRP